MSPEIRRDRPQSINGCCHVMSAWSVYIDNLDLFEVLEWDEGLSKQDSVEHHDWR